jgi:pre-mRNA-splicing factor SYF1
MSVLSKRPKLNSAQMFKLYIAKAASNYGLPATRPIYERALQVLPSAPAAVFCVRFAALERKLGEVDRARAIYAHGAQFCDPRVNPDFWAEWNAFEVDAGSEDTFREMLRIKRSVQAQFNTEASFLAAQTMAAARRGAQVDLDAGPGPADPMAAAEQAAGKAPAFVAAKKTSKPVDGDEAPSSAGADANVEEIHISDEEM